MCFSVGVGRNALPWFQPSDSGKEIVLRPLPVHSIRGRALPQMRQRPHSAGRYLTPSVQTRLREPHKQRATAYIPSAPFRRGLQAHRFCMVGSHPLPTNIRPVQSEKIRRPGIADNVVIQGTFDLSILHANCLHLMGTISGSLSPCR